MPWCSSCNDLMGRRGMCPGEANYFRYYKRLGVIAKLATSYFLWTSKPAHRVNTTSISHLYAPQGLAGYPEQKRLPCVRDFPEEAGDSLWCRQVSRSSFVT